MADPKKGTGKKPKGSGRRLYTDENPKDTVSIKYATVADAKKTIRKVKKINKPYARKIQILTVIEQRSKYLSPVSLDFFPDLVLHFCLPQALRLL